MNSPPNLGYPKDFDSSKILHNKYLLRCAALGPSSYFFAHDQVGHVAIRARGNGRHRNNIRIETIKNGGLVVVNWLRFAAPGGAFRTQLNWPQWGFHMEQ